MFSVLPLVYANTGGIARRRPRECATIVGMRDHAKALAAAADEYRRLLTAREKLIEAIRAAQADGMRQVDILEATDHVWTREQVRRLGLT